MIKKKELIKGKTKNRHLIKSNKITVVMKENEQVNPLHHKNIHFKKEYSKEKSRLFFN